jgi:hypothetical protein
MSMVWITATGFAASYIIKLCKVRSVTISFILVFVGSVIGFQAKWPFFDSAIYDVSAFRSFFN